jgi:glycine/D-amino acid oxidase-like deaminating enzyme
MDLLSGQPYWFYKNGALYDYPALTHDLTTDVVILGGGITGALLAWHLTQAGREVTVLEKRHIGLGSTSGSTALLQYEIDTMLTDLIGMMGEQRAARCYQLCVEAIGKIEGITRQVDTDTGFALRKSIYYASKKADLSALEAEFVARQKHGIRVDWWDKSTLQTHFPNLPQTGAILSHNGAQVDAYRLAHALFQCCQAKQAQVYDTVEVTDIDYRPRSVVLRLASGWTVKARKLVVAAGYESQQYLNQQVLRLHSSYALVSKPVDQPFIWYENALLWESARPYVYLRTTDNGRVLIGGKDEMFQSAPKRDRLLSQKRQQLEQTARRFFPHLNLQTDYAWCGTFGETEDGLPYIGTVPERPNTYFALGYGGNGILFSLIAAEIITDLIQGRRNPDADLFRFDR